MLARAGAPPEIHIRQWARAHTNTLSDWEPKVGRKSGTAKALRDAPILSIQHLSSLWTHYAGNSLQMMILKRKISLLFNFHFVDEIRTLGQVALNNFTLHTWDLPASFWKHAFVRRVRGSTCTGNRLELLGDLSPNLPTGKISQD